MFKRVLSLISISVLVACGGGGNDASNASGDLRTAYDRVQCGMSPESVKAAVGEKPANEIISNGEIIGLTWAKSNPANALTVNFFYKVVNVKIFSGSGQTISQSCK